MDAEVSSGTVSEGGREYSRRNAGSDADDKRARRREINRKSQQRIRERQKREVEDLKDEVHRLQTDNTALIRQVEAAALEKRDMARQLQELTDKWQSAVAEYISLSRETVSLRSSLEQLIGLMRPEQLLSLMRPGDPGAGPSNAGAAL